LSGAFVELSVPISPSNSIASPPLPDQLEIGSLLLTPISNSSEFLFGSPQASNDAFGSWKVKSDQGEDNNLVLQEDLLGEIIANELCIDETTNSLQTLVVEMESPTYSFPELEGRYHVLEKIGEGTFSNVFKAISLDSRMEIVALKRINPTCSPQRILNEMRFLHLLGGKGHVAPLLGAIRDGHQVTLVLPLIEHQKFKDYLPLMTVAQIRQYMKALFESLQHLHSYNIIHRDLKPGNFLHNLSTNTFALVDFGLAQIHVDPSMVENAIKGTRSNPSPSLKRKRNEGLLELTMRMKYSGSSTNSGRNNTQDTQGTQLQTLRAPRGGTRGFRAPEVLLKCYNQTTAIDVWSAGVILLSILSTRYPFFSSPDDLASLAEIGALFGTKEVKDVALLLNRRITFPCHPQEIPKSPLKNVCTRLSSRQYLMPDSAFHLLERCLDINPMTRITATEALKHPFLLNDNDGY